MNTSQKKKRHPVLGFLGLLVLALGLLALLTALWVLLVRRDLSSVRLAEPTVYAEIPSLRQVYADWLPLEAADLILSSPGLEDAQALLADWRRQDWANHPTLGALLDLPASLSLSGEGPWLGVFDLGWRSALTRWLNLLGGFWVPDGLGLYRSGGHNLFFWQQAERRVYLALADNLVLVSDQADLITKVLNPSGDDSVPGGQPLETAWPDLGRNAQVRFLARPEPLLTDLETDPESWIRWLVGQKLLPPWASGALALDGNGLEAAFRLPLNPPDRDLGRLLAHRPAALRILPLLPEETVLATVLNWTDLSDLLQLWSSFDASLEAQVSQADQGLRLAFGQGLDELVYSWLDREWGVAFLEGQAQPLIFLGIKDPAALERALQRLEGSWALEGDTRLVVDGLRLRRLSLPAYLQALLGLFSLELPSPYLWVQGRTLWISLDPAVLARAEQAQRRQTLLSRHPDFAALGPQTGAPAFGAWYDLSRRAPWFLQNNSLWARVLALYGRGWIQLGPEGRDWLLRARARVRRPEGWAAAPGFPRPWPGQPEDPWWYGPAAGAGGIRQVALLNDRLLEFSDAAGLDRVELPLKLDQRMRLWERDGRLQGLWLYDAAGEVILLDPRGRPRAGFPLATAEGPSEAALAEDGALWFAASGQWFRVLPSGQFEQGVLPFEGPVTTEPLVRSEGVYWYERRFGGALWALFAPGDAETGQVKPGWPVAVEGLASAGPTGFEGPGPVVLISSAGLAQAWGPEGRLAPGWPVDLNAVIRRRAFPLGPERLVVTDERGEVRVLGRDGQELARWKDRNAGSETHWQVAQGPAWPVPILISSGQGQFLRGFTLEGQAVSGFPWTGSGTPRALDLDGDGQGEWLSPGLDRRLYAYRWYGPAGPRP